MLDEAVTARHAPKKDGNLEHPADPNDAGMIAFRSALRELHGLLSAERGLIYGSRGRTPFLRKRNRHLGSITLAKLRMLTFAAGDPCPRDLTVGPPIDDATLRAVHDASPTPLVGGVMEYDMWSYSIEISHVLTSSPFKVRSVNTEPQTMLPYEIAETLVLEIDGLNAVGQMKFLKLGVSGMMEMLLKRTMILPMLPNSRPVREAVMYLKGGNEYDASALNDTTMAVIQSTLLLLKLAAIDGTISVYAGTQIMAILGRILVLVGVQAMMGQWDRVAGILRSTVDLMKELVHIQNATGEKKFSGLCIDVRLVFMMLKAAFEQRGGMSTASLNAALINTSNSFVNILHRNKYLCSHVAKDGGRAEIEYPGVLQAARALVKVIDENKESDEDASSSEDGM
jgi:hypothetical protein